MTPKVKDVPLPKLPQSPLDKAAVTMKDDTESAYSSLISTTPRGLSVKAKTNKKTLLGGAK